MDYGMIITVLYHYNDCGFDKFNCHPTILASTKRAQAVDFSHQKVFNRDTNSHSVAAV